MSFSSIQASIYNWCLAVTLLPAGSVQFADQSQHRPPRPFLSIKVGPDAGRVGTDELRISGSTFVQAGARTARVSLNIEGAGALSLMEKLRDSTDQPTVVDTYFSSQGIAVVDTSNIRDLTSETIEDNVFLQRAQLDLTIRYSTNIDDSAGSGEIDHVTMSGPTNSPYGTGSTQIN